MIPGAFLILTGILGFFVGLSNLHISNTTFGPHTMLFASLAFLCGYQTLWFAIFAKVFAINEHFIPEDIRLTKFFSYATLERGIILGTIALLIGITLLAVAIYRWYSIDFQAQNYQSTLPRVISGSTLAFIGFQTILSSFFVSLLGMSRKAN